MKQSELNRMFDALPPTPEREQVLLEEIFQNGARKKMPMKNTKKWRQIVVCVVAVALLITSTAAATIAFFRVQISEPDENGDIWLSNGITYYRLDNLSDELKAMDGQPDDILTFDSWGETEKFIGIDLMNNPILDASSSEHYSVQFTRGSKTVRGQFVVMTYTSLDQIIIRSCYEIGEVNIDVESNLFTNRMTELNDDWEENFLGYSFSDETSLEWETYTALSGLEAQIIQINRVEGHRDTCLAAFSLNGIPTIVRTHSRNSLEDARAVLIQILDGFTF